MPIISVKCKSCREYNKDNCVGNTYACDQYISDYSVPKEDIKNWPTEMRSRYNKQTRAEKFGRNQPKAERVNSAPIVEAGQVLYYVNKFTGKTEAVLVQSVDDKNGMMIILFLQKKKYVKVYTNRVGRSLFLTKESAERNAR